MFDDDDLSLLEGLTEDELQQLSFQVDPEQSLLTASERCSYKTKRPDTRMYQREHLMNFMEKLAAESTVGKDYVPYKKKQTEPQPSARRPSPLPQAQLSTEEAEELSQMTETELMELAAYIGATNVLTQEQIHAVEVGKRPEGSAFRKQTIVKSTVPTSCGPKEPEQDLDVLELKRALKEGKVSVITINNQPELENDVFEEILMSLDENGSLRHLSLANTGMNDKVAKALVESVACNTVLETLNLESNYISPGSLLDLVKAVCQNESMRELRIANQKVRLGLQYEEKIASALVMNHTLLRIGLTIENAGPRNKIDRFLIRNNDQLRQARQQGKEAYNFNNVKNFIKNAPQPWLRTRGIFQTGELNSNADDNEDGVNAEPMSRLKKTGYVYEQSRSVPIVNLFEEEGITPEEAVQLRAQQLQDGVERQVKQSDMLGELTEMLAKRKSRQASQSESDYVMESLPGDGNESIEAAASPKSIQSAVEEEMAAALQERQRKIIEQGEVDEEEEEREERRRRRRRGRGRRRDDDNEDGAKDEGEDAKATKEEDSQVTEHVQEGATDTITQDESDGKKTEEIELEPEEPSMTQRQRDRSKRTEQNETAEENPNEATAESLEQADQQENQTAKGDADVEEVTESDLRNRNESPKEDNEEQKTGSGDEERPRRRRRTRNRETDDSQATGNEEKEKVEGDDEDGSIRRRRMRKQVAESEDKDEQTKAGSDDEERPNRRRRTRNRDDGEDLDNEEERPSRRNRRERTSKDNDEEDSTTTGRRQRTREREDDEEKKESTTDVEPSTQSKTISTNKDPTQNGETCIEEKKQPNVDSNSNIIDEAEIGRPLSLRERRRLKAAAGC